MQKYTAPRKLTDASYNGLKPDQARALFLIAEAGKEGLTDDQLKAFKVNEAGEVVTEGGTPLKVKMALLRTGHVVGETIIGERKGSERTYQYTGVALSDDLSPALKSVGSAVRTLNMGTKSQFAEQLVRDSQAAADAAVAAGNEAPAVLDIEKANRAVNGVWLRLQDRGIIVAVKKSEAAAAAEPAAQGGEQLEQSYNEQAPE